MMNEQNKVNEHEQISEPCSSETLRLRDAVPVYPIVCADRIDGLLEGRQGGRTVGGDPREP